MTVLLDWSELVRGPKNDFIRARIYQFGGDGANLALKVVKLSGDHGSLLCYEEAFVEFLVVIF